MSDLRQLYQEILLEHYRKPRNFGPLDDATHHARGHNPLCGDKVEVFLELDGEAIRAASFDGAGCAISTATASMMTEAIAGGRVDEARALGEQFLAMVRADADAEVDTEGLGELASLEGVRRVPVRVKCATLAWHALRAALDDGAIEKDGPRDDAPNTVTTE
ncbi:MAG: Fe-S cluster assembly sulfur transfer protein SufU [Acidobacteriota bacterium]